MLTLKKDAEYVYCILLYSLRRQNFGKRRFLIPIKNLHRFLIDMILRTMLLERFSMSLKCPFLLQQKSGLQRVYQLIHTATFMTIRGQDQISYNLLQSKPGMAHFNPSSESCVPYIKAGMPFLMGEPTSAVKGSKNTVDWKYNE